MARITRGTSASHTLASISLPFDPLQAFHVITAVEFMMIREVPTR